MHYQHHHTCSPPRPAHPATPHTAAASQSEAPVCTRTVCSMSKHLTDLLALISFPPSLHLSCLPSLPPSLSLFHLSFSLLGYLLILTQDLTYPRLALNMLCNYEFLVLLPRLLNAGIIRYSVLQFCFKKLHRVFGPS